ncbi:GtrA family protein [Cellulosimicrobium sp. MI9406]|uniref:GtrA family protein n=1 Tax=Cellulosimicrobium sp. MI9406 TaxID=2931398 RepID=UPI0033A82455
MVSDLDRRAETSATSGSRRERVLARVRELAKFGSVGALAYVVDLGLFNLLSFGPGELLGHKPLTAKIVSVAVATLVAWVGNRYWTFSDRRTQSRGRELAAFVVVNVGGMLIAVGCLAISTYALGLTSPLAKNISANVVGLALGTAFRYVAYRHLVFTGDRPDAATPAKTADGATRPPADVRAD